MKLKTLLKDLPIQQVKGSQSITINGICSNSKKIKPGDLFIARKGTHIDGAEFIPNAIMAGAVAVLTDMYNPFYSNIVQIITKDVNTLEPTIATRFYKSPSKNLYCVGITGTNGKTTTSYLVKYILESCKGPCGLIGTIETIIKDYTFPSELTTPDCVTIQTHLHEMVANGCKHAALEVSSHALDQNRVGEIDFDICAFTNLSQDHLDYHHGMEEYALAKAKLFSMQKDVPHTKQTTQYAVLNRDDPYFSVMKQHVISHLFTYGIENQADLYAKDLDLSSDQSTFTLVYSGKEYPMTTLLLGRFNVYNILCAISIGICKGIPLHQIIPLFTHNIVIPGRMQKVPNKKGLSIFIDYAHTPDALEKSLKTLNEIKKNNLSVVFGCGGNRDRTKRPLMLQVAASLADQVIVTSDNPRFEEPKQIIDDMFAGNEYPHTEIILERKSAIATAIMKAKKGDIILIAGKGHERQQIFHNMTLDFDDYLVAKELCDQYGTQSLV